MIFGLFFFNWRNLMNDLLSVWFLINSLPSKVMKPLRQRAIGNEREGKYFRKNQKPNPIEETGNKHLLLLKKKKQWIVLNNWKSMYVLWFSVKQRNFSNHLITKFVFFLVPVSLVKCVFVFLTVSSWCFEFFACFHVTTHISKWESIWLVQKISFWIMNHFSNVCSNIFGLGRIGNVNFYDYTLVYRLTLAWLII